MLPEGIASIPSAASHGAALAARTHAAEAHAAHEVNPQSVIERVNAYGFQGDVVTTSIRWWLPSVHPRSIAFLSTGTGVTWQL